MNMFFTVVIYYTIVQPQYFKDLLMESKDFCPVVFFN